MSSTMTTPSASTLIANGLTYKLSDVDIAGPKLNKSGGKSANLIYKPTKKALYLNMQVPLLTWGATSFKDPQSGKETFDLALQFPRKDYSSKETDKLLANMQALENKIKAEAIQNSMAWFNKKTMTPEVIEALWTPMLKYPKDQSTGEPDVTKAPTLKVKMPCWEGKFDCEIYDPAGNMLFPDLRTGATPIELIPKGVNIVAIIQCGGLWFANGKFGCTWRLFQAVVQPKPSMKGKCLISVTADLTPVAAAVSSLTPPQANDEDEQGVEVQDDEEEDDDEQDDLIAAVVETAQTPVAVVEAPVAVVVAAPTVAAPTPVVVAPAPVVAQTPVVAVAVAEAEKPKKKVVRKKE